MAEFSKINLPNYKYPLYDFTSSGLTHTWPEKWPETNKYRLGELIIKKNFGLIVVSKAKGKTQVRLESRGKDGAVFEKVQFSFGE